MNRTYKKLKRWKGIKMFDTEGINLNIEILDHIK